MTHPPSPPPPVLELAQQVAATPLAWRITDAAIIITFHDGRKLTFDKTDLPTSTQSNAAPNPEKSKPKEIRTNG